MELEQTHEEKRGAFWLELKADDFTEEGTFTGYLAVFGNVDFGGDVIEKGAFADALGKKAVYPMLADHDMTKVIGGLELAEDNKGLKITKGYFNLDVQGGKEGYSNAKKGYKTGFSIGYAARDWEIVNEKNRVIRRIKRCDLYEGSHVAFPMNDKARLLSIKCEAGSLKEFESFLRDAGFSRKDATTIASCGFKTYLQQRDAGADSAEMVEAIKTLKTLTERL